jgi:hypothetical protein
MGYSSDTTKGGTMSTEALHIEREDYYSISEAMEIIGVGYEAVY